MAGGDAQNPFKQDRKLSPEQHRLAMTRIAVLGEPGLVASGFELDLPKPNYTTDTLAFMRQRWPQHTFSLIVGSDNLASLHTWKDRSPSWTTIPCSCTRVPDWRSTWPRPTCCITLR